MRCHLALAIAVAAVALTSAPLASAGTPDWDVRAGLSFATFGAGIDLVGEAQVAKWFQLADAAGPALAVGVVGQTTLTQVAYGGEYSLHSEGMSRFGGVARLHGNPSGVVDPYVAVELAYAHGKVSNRDAKGWADFALQLGLDFRIGPVSIGPFFQITTALSKGLFDSPKYNGGEYADETQFPYYDLGLHVGVGF